MRKFILILLLLTLTILYAEARDLFLGKTLNELLISSEKVDEKGILYLRRHKDYVYEDPRQRNITGIIAYDLLGPQGNARVTEGGLGHPYVKLHLKSGRSDDLSFMIQIFVKNEPKNL